MDRFEQNYWGLFADFLEGFKEWTYNGHPLAFGIHFYSLLKDRVDLERNLLHPSYIKTGRGGQKVVDAYLPDYEWKNTKGKVVFYDKLLRIPSSVYPVLVPLSESILLKSDVTNIRSTPVQGMEMVGLIGNKANGEESVRKVEKSFSAIATRFHSHPLFGKKNVHTQVKKQISKYMKYLNAAEHFFEKTEVSLLIMGETNSLDTRSLAMTARKKGIPTICLQHGAIVSSFGYLPKIAIYQGVYGLYEQAFYQSAGVDARYLPIIGHPRFDGITSNQHMNPSLFYKQTQTDRKRKRLLIVDHHTDKSKNLKIIDGLLKKVPETELILKIQKGSQAYNHYAKHPRVHIVTRMNLEDLLSYSDAVISYESTVVLEALLAGKRTFVWKLNQAGLTDYFSKLPVERYIDVGELVDDVVTYINEGKQTHVPTEEVRKSFYIPERSSSTLLLKALIQNIRSKAD
ncbi:hypothetical protein J0K78_11090 [Halobacillus sp. GSS1]|uniref:hypothetical protein n=1 Tax=Halobacillus sp. GSS1 TaxID=2815919 RepID=UPI001A903490|nr:hypothetical protein [Halobacillus sp. GSS1]MBN9654811.1 hypothetical protein [Halobacillus sp. GSS1]